MSASTRIVTTPTSRCRFGIGIVDITPPVGIYHRFWGAASHDQATGVHRPLTATVMIWQSLATDNPSELHVTVAIDHCLFREDDMRRLRDETLQAVDAELDSLTFTFSHTHSGGHIYRARANQPGGDKIGPYLDGLPAKLVDAFATARDSLQAATLTYATTTSDMGHQRDYWDDETQQYVCGFNPDETFEIPLNVVRVTNDNGDVIAGIVNYPCHPTTLAWGNTLISPDYVGALREVVENTISAPCLFLQGASGDIGPRYGFVGDPAVADRNGRQLAFTALAALESMPPAQFDYQYAGPVISGATIGEWKLTPQQSSRQQQTARFRYRHWELSLPYRADLQTVAQGEQELHQHLRQEQTARQAGDDAAAADFRAMAERSRRLLERLQPLPQREYPFPLSVWQLGDAFWVAVEGEPYHALQQDLMQRFPDKMIIVTELADGARCSYLPTREAYEKPLYQSDIALLASGCLERITDEIGDQIEAWQRD